ncbi:MAG: hypothetical protein IT567_02030 [Alphaproteobacteria bacterium]|nr:hypothetical protein [Alphaproteobacteria bacterium]
MKKFLWIPVFFLAAILVASCGSAATPAPAPEKLGYGEWATEFPAQFKDNGWSEKASGEFHDVFADGEYSVEDGVFTSSKYDSSLVVLVAPDLDPALLDGEQLEVWGSIYHQADGTSVLVIRKLWIEKGG